MLNLFKKKTDTTDIIFRCVGPETLVEYFAPTKSMTRLPDWFSKIKKHDPRGNTMRQCPGFIELFKKSISIPMWQDMSLTYRDAEIQHIDIPSKNFGGKDGTNILNVVQQHHPYQWANQWENHAHIKLMNPWIVQCKKPIPFLLHDPTWHKEKITDWQVVPGVNEFVVNSSLHLNMYLPRYKTDKTIQWHAGDIMAYLTPLIDTKINIVIEQVSIEEFEKQMWFRFGNSYSKALQRINKMLRKC